MAERELLSKGDNAQVFLPNEEDKRYFQPADLVRIGNSGDMYSFARSFHKHKIAKLLFPDNFIEVCGAKNSLESSDTECERIRFNDYLYSKLADVHPDHAIYTLHMDKSSGNKHSVCTCDACKNHRAFHAEYDLQVLAKNQADKIRETGIIVEWWDHSDFCLNLSAEVMEQRQVIFFEMLKFDREMIHSFLTGSDVDAEKKKQIFAYIERYRASMRLSRDRMLRGEGELKMS